MRNLMEQTNTPQLSEQELAKRKALEKQCADEINKACKANSCTIDVAVTVSAFGNVPVMQIRYVEPQAVAEAIAE